MATNSPESIDCGVQTTDMVCHNILEIAHLQGLWTPDELPPEVSSEAPFISYLAARTADDEPLSTMELARANEFCGEVVDTAKGLFTRADHPKYAPYRTTEAIDADEGNCVAFHETISGILRAAGLYDNIAGAWMGGHARTGLLLGDTLFYLDGYDGSVTVVSMRPGDIMLEAWTEVLDTGDPVRIDVNTENQPIHKTKFELGDMGKIRTHEDQELIMSAGSLVLAISALGALNNPKLSGKTKNVLQPFAPEL